METCDTWCDHYVCFHILFWHEYLCKFQTLAHPWKLKQLPCHHLCLFSNPSSDPPMTSCVAGPNTSCWVASLLATEEWDRPISVSSTPQSSIAPSDSASQACQQRSPKNQTHSDNNLTDHSIPTSDDKNLLCGLVFFIPYCTNVYFLLSRLHALQLVFSVLWVIPQGSNTMDAEGKPIYTKAEDGKLHITRAQRVYLCASDMHQSQITWCLQSVASSAQSQATKTWWRGFPHVLHGW